MHKFLFYHHHVHEGLRTFPVPWSSRWIWSLHLPRSSYVSSSFWFISCFIISLLYVSTCFEHYVLIIRTSKLYHTASGIITTVGGRPVHRLRKSSLNLFVCIMTTLIWKSLAAATIFLLIFFNSVFKSIHNIYRWEI